jgi:16S rRNA processing protein RimM
LRIGQVVGSRGLKGQFKVNPLTTYDEYFDAGEEILIDGEWYEISSCVWLKDRPHLTLEGVDTVEAAEALKWKFIDAEVLEFEEDADEFKIGDLLGCSVFDQTGEELGKLDEVMTLPAHDVYRIGTVMIPAVKEFVKKVDLANKRIDVQLIPGMRGEEVD